MLGAQAPNLRRPRCAFLCLSVVGLVQLRLRGLAEGSIATCTLISPGMCAANRPAVMQATAAHLHASIVVDAGIAYPTGDFSFKVIQPFPKVLAAELVDPFLMCDEWGSSTKEMGAEAFDPGEPEVLSAPHVGWHPHRGFDILSYVKEGRGHHADSLGNVATVRPGGIQWMRTGSGIEHAEGSGSPEGTNRHGFQIWINLPPSLKMSEPQYGTVQPEDIPEMHSEAGGLSRLLAGPGGASFQARDDVHIADCELPPSSSHKHLVPANAERLIIYVYRGNGIVGDRPLQTQQAALFRITANMQESDSDKVSILLQAGTNGFGVLVFAGLPMEEPIAWQGPIVMNTPTEINVAYSELRIGNFLKTKVAYDYRNAASRA